MVTRTDSIAPGLSRDGDAGVLCVHFAADGREHSMWYLDPEEAGFRGLTGFTAGLVCAWSRSAAGVPRAVVARRGADVLCEALLLRTTDGDGSLAGTSAWTGTAGGTGLGTSAPFTSDSRRRDNALLRAEGVPSYPASMIAGIRQRPLLVSFARKIDLPAPLARHVHGLLLQTLPAEARCPVCAGMGLVRGEPCLACS